MSAISKFKNILKLLNVTDLETLVKKPSAFNYPFHSYQDKELQQFFKEQMINSEIQKSFILTTQQSTSKLSPEIYIVSNQHIYYVAFDADIKIFDKDFQELISISKHSFYHLKTDFLQYNKNSSKSYLELNKNVKIMLDNSNDNIFKLTKSTKTGISKITLSDDILVEFKKCFYDQMVLNYNFDILKLDIRDFFTKSSEGLLNHTLYNIKDFNSLYLKIKEYSDIHNLITDKKFNPKINEEKFNLQLSDIKNLVENKNYIFKQMKIILDHCSFMRENKDSLYNFLNSKYLMDIPRNPFELQKLIGENTLDEMNKAKGNYTKKNNYVLSISLLWNIQQSSELILNNNIIDSISLLQEKVKETRNFLSYSKKDNMLKLS